MFKTQEKIDFVLTWVDGNDAEWYEQKKIFENTVAGDDRTQRYRDWDNLRYWFRAVEKYAPWVNKIFFVTWGHVPKWLDTSNPKIKVVKHSDFIPQEYLPTFNTNVIEMNFHRIAQLNEHFVYFNDDVFLNNNVKEKDFFINGMPCDMLAFQPIVIKPENTVMAHIYLNNTVLLSKYFKKRKNVRSQPLNYFRPGYPPIYFMYNLLELAFPLFTGFFTAHGAAPLCKETYRILWDKEQSYLDDMCRHKFRDKEDVNQYLLREWQKLSGKFHAKNILKDFRYFELGDNNSKLIQTIKKKKAKVICMNDTSSQIKFEKAKKELQKAFADVLPDKSNFECQSVFENESVEL